MIKVARLGVFARGRPASNYFGFDRGYCIDRFYIDQFFSVHSSDVQGAVLEIGDDVYTKRFGQAVTTSDVLHLTGESPSTTIVGDLTKPETLPQAKFDCVICTQTLHLIPDVERAIRTLYQILKPGGVLLATMPCISQLSRDDVERFGEYWRFTSMGAEKLIGGTFDPHSVSVEARGNLTAAVGFLSGLTVEDVGSHRLERFDPEFEVIVLVRAVRNETVT